MVEKIVRPERRQTARRQDRLAALGEVVGDGGRGERRTHCWDLEPECTEERRKRCSAYFVKRNCWDLWAAEYFPPGRKPCCHPDLDCSQCPVAGAKFAGPISIYVEVPAREVRHREAPTASRSATYCRYLFRAADGPSQQGDNDGKPVFRCRRRPGIQLHATYVSEVCGCPEHRDCTFFGAE
jgi:hypothetical protein